MVPSQEGQEKLGLSESQIEEIRKIRSAYVRTLGGSFGGGAPQSQNLSTEERFRQRYEESEKRAAENLEKILAILTPEQKAKWSEMTGAPFKFPSRRSAASGSR